jgi:hypothetical protein
MSISSSLSETSKTGEMRSCQCAIAILMDSFRSNRHANPVKTEQHAGFGHVEISGSTKLLTLLLQYASFGYSK